MNELWPLRWWLFNAYVPGNGDAKTYIDNLYLMISFILSEQQNCAEVKKKPGGGNVITYLQDNFWKRYFLGILWWGGGLFPICGMLTLRAKYNSRVSCFVPGRQPTMSFLPVDISSPLVVISHENTEFHIFKVFNAFLRKKKRQRCYIASLNQLSVSLDPPPLSFRSLSRREPE